jgi:hypothetical protein
LLTGLGNSARFARTTIQKPSFEVVFIKPSGSGSLPGGTEIGLSGDAARRRKAKTPPALDAVGFEIVVIDSQNQAERVPLCKVNQRCIGEIHRPITIAFHERVKRWKISLHNR